MNSKQYKLYLLTSVLAFAILANVSGSAVYATGGLDDEEEEEALEDLQNQITELNDSLEQINLNLTSGPNQIQANCPSIEEVVEEVVENITNGGEEQQPPAEEQPQCPFAPPANETEEQPPTTVIPPIEAAPEEPQGCPLAQEEPEQNVTEAIEEVIENVTQQTCNIPQEAIPGIVLPEINETIVEEEEQPPADEVPICPFTGLPIGQAPEPAQNNVTEEEQQQQPPATITDGEPIAEIEFDSGCSCFVIDKTPEEVQ
jgi:hypothetical protein